LAKTRISPYWKGRLVEFFFGVPAYRLRFQVPYGEPTILKRFRIFREGIYIVGKNSGLWLNLIYPDNIIIKKKKGHIPLRDYDKIANGEKSALKDFKERYYFKITTLDKRADNLLLTQMNVFSKDFKKDYVPWKRELLKNCVSLKRM